jgi:hypothetical protein
MRREFSSLVTLALKSAGLGFSLRWPLELFELAELEDREVDCFFAGLLLLELVLGVVTVPSSSLSDDFDFLRNIFPIDRGFFAIRSGIDLKRLCGVAMI